MRLLDTPESKLKLSEARRQMSDALDILDELNAPDEIGISLDLAIARLEKYLGCGSNGESTVHHLMNQIERELTALRDGGSDTAVPWEMSPR